MSSLAIAGLVFLCIFGAALLGVVFARRLPEHHLRPESRDALKQGLGLIATLTALVLGLLVAGAKGTYDTQNNTVRQMAADVILLDRVLAMYGTETKEAREETKEARDLLPRGIAATLSRIWPDEAGHPANLAPGESRALMETFYDKVAGLPAQNDTQRSLKGRALDLTTGLLQTRLRLFAQKESSIPLPFLMVLVFWLVVLFFGFGLLAAPNATVITSLLVCTLSVSGALFLIMELDKPFDGIVQVSSAPLRAALEQVGK